MTRAGLAILASIVPDEFDRIRVLGPYKSKQLVAIRRSVATHMRSLGYSLPRIGRELNRHHTSILNLLAGEEWKRKRAVRMKAYASPLKVAS